MKLRVLILLVIIPIQNFAQSKSTLDSINTVLESIFDSDQFSRRQIDTLQRMYGQNSDSVKNFWDKKLGVLDSIHTIQIKQILNHYGWLGTDQISQKANMTFFLVIQHADITTQKEFLPKLQDAIKNKKTDPQFYAYLKDRVLMLSGKYQIYGTQFGGDVSGQNMLWPIADAPQVNHRRKRLGLGPLEQYAADAGVSFSLPKIDSFQNSVIVNGFVTDTAGRPISDVEIVNSGRILSLAGKNGSFKLIVKKELLNSLFLRKKGFVNLPLKVDQYKADIFYSDFVMNKQ